MESSISNLKNKSFSNLYRNSSSSFSIRPGLILEGSVSEAKKDIITIDVGLKTPILFLSEELRRYTDFLKMDTKNFGFKKGEHFVFHLDSMAGFDGDVVLSNSKALKALKNKSIWDSIVDRKFVNGRVLNHVNGGYSVGIGGLVTFLPQNQSFRPKNPELYVKSLRTFYILKTNSSKRNVVVSRKIAVNQWNRLSRAAYNHNNTFNTGSNYNSTRSVNLEDRVSEWKKLLLEKSSTLE